MAAAHCNISTALRRLLHYRRLIGMKQTNSFLVAHRSDRCGGVENTLEGFAAAAAAGARFAECDIQFSRDLVPLVIHDNLLKRLCGLDVRVSEMTANELRRICRPYFELSSLPDLLLWLRTVPPLTLFIEIKSPVRRRLADDSIARRITALLPDDLLPRVVAIGMSASLMDACAAIMPCPVGWVAEGVREPQATMPYIFMPWQRIDAMARWQSRGSKVALYTVNDAATVVALRAAGADMIETNYFSGMVSEIG